MRNLQGPSAPLAPGVNPNDLQPIPLSIVKDAAARRTIAADAEYIEDLEQTLCGALWLMQAAKRGGTVDYEMAERMIRETLSKRTT